MGIREPDKRDADSARLEDDAARSIEQMQVLIDCKQRIRHAAPFIILRNEQDGHARRCEAFGGALLNHLASLVRQSDGFLGRLDMPHDELN